MVYIRLSDFNGEPTFIYLFERNFSLVLSVRYCFQFWVTAPEWAPPTED